MTNIFNKLINNIKKDFVLLKISYIYICFKTFSQFYWFFICTIFHSFIFRKILLIDRFDQMNTSGIV